MSNSRSTQTASFTRLIWFGLLPALLILIGVSAFAYVESQKRSALSTRIRAERGTVNALAALRIDLLNAETGQRGYILTGEQAYLQPYTVGSKNISKDFTTLDTLYKGTSDTTVLTSIQSLARQKLAELGQSISLYDRQGFAVAQGFVRQGNGKEFMDQIQASLNQLQAAQEVRLNADLAASTKTTNLTNQATLAGSLLSVLIISVTLLLIKRILDGQVALTHQAEASYQEVLKAKKLLEEAEANDEALLSSIGDGLLVSDNNGIVLRSNSVLEEMIGATKKDLVHLNLLKITLRDLENEIVTVDKMPISIALTKSKRTGGRYLMDHADGSKFPVAVTVSPVILNKKTVGTISLIRDVSQEIEIDRAKTEFVSLASHQLRTPLSAINWYTEMLLNGDAGKISEEQRSFLQQVYASSQRMVELVNSLLNVSRLELGTFSVEPVEMDITTIAESVISELRPQLEERKQKLEHEYDKKLPKIMLDQKLVRMVLQNILSNAVKYTQEGGRIRIAITDEPADAHLEVPHILVTIADNGYGIPRSQQGQIFGKLFRADNVTDKDTEGTGLGLYITRAVMDQTGGSISFTSKESKGTTFFIAIPRSGMRKRDGNKGLS